MLMACSASNQNNSVVVITDESYVSLVTNGRNDIWFMMFYAPWCQHCKNVRPIFEELSIFSDLKNFGIKFGVIDATVQKEVAAKCVFAIIFVALLII